MAQPKKQSSSLKINDSLAVIKNNISVIGNNFNDPYLVLLVGSAGKIEFINKYIHYLWGKKQSWLDRSWQEIFSSDSEKKFEKILAQASRRGHIFEVEESLKIKKQKFFFRVLVVPIKEGFKKPIFYLIFLKNITAEKSKEATLKESEEKYRYIFENSQNLLWYISDSARILDVNETALKLFGYKKNELIGKNIASFIPLKYMPRLLHDLAFEVKGGKADPLTIEIKKKNGDLISVDLYPGSLQIFDENKKPIGIMVSGRDASMRHGLELTLRKEKNKFQQLFNNLQDPFIYLKPATDTKKKSLDFQYIDVNKAYAEMIGEAPEKLLNKNFSNFSSFFKTAELKVLHKIAKSGGKANFEIYDTASRKYYKIDVFQPAPNTCAVVFKDITEQKNSENLIIIQRDLGILLGESKELAQAIRIFVDKITEIIELDCSGFWALGEDGRLELSEKKGWGKDFIEKNKHFVLGPEIKNIIQQKKIKFYSAGKINVFNDKKSVANEKILSAAAIPIIENDIVLGVLLVGSHIYSVLSSITKKNLQILANQINNSVVRISKERNITVSEEKYKGLSETQEEGVVLLDNLCAIKYANPAFGKLTGYSHRDLIGKNFQMFFTAQTALDVFENCRRDMRKTAHKVLDKELEMTRKDGKKFLASVSSVPILEQKQIKYIQLTIRDITEIKKAELALSQKLEELEKINKLLVGRELKMVELKKRLTELENKFKK